MWRETILAQFLSLLSKRPSSIYKMGIIIPVCPNLREIVALKEEDDLLKFFDSLSLMTRASI